MSISINFMPRNKKSQIVPLIFETYLAVIKNSLKSTLFRNFYAEVEGKKQDIMKGGGLSCAFFVSSILVMFGLVERIHGTVAGAIKDLEKSGWQKIKKPRLGSILIWEAIDFGKNNIHKHMGFYIGLNQAISNNSKLKYPVKHHWTFGLKNNKPKRKVEAIFWNKQFK